MATAIPNKYYKLIFDIASVVQATHIQSEFADIDPDKIIDDFGGLDYLLLNLHVTAPVGGATIQLRLYFEDLLLSSTVFCMGDLIPDIVLTAGEHFIAVEPIYVGPGRCAVALEACEDDTAITVSSRRVPIGKGLQA